LLRRATIRGEDGAPVKPGEPGELWMAGRGIMKGYFNKPEANADAFRDDWFRTGDVTRQDERGFFYIIGRLKDMVRRSGENVAAREVEAVALLLPEVKEAAVVPVPDKDRGEEVKIFLALQEGVPADEATIARVAAHCRANLASYKVPRYYAFLPELPRTASNKIEKGKLKTLHPEPRQGAYDTVDRLWR
ncbi:MAG: AMP-binding protein, partial [Alphaproteobacteria bacterium]|nr:AMP-binding protein [Alphaproteobacteria bacterium]